MAWHTIALSFLIHTALGGSLLLLAGAVAVRCCREPVRRIRLIELALAGALLLPLVALLPGLPRWSAGWLPPAPEPMSPVAAAEGFPDLDASLALAAPTPAVEVA